MKRHLTFNLKAVHPDYNIKIPKDLQKRVEKPFKLLGDIKVGKGLEMHFEDGFIFKTSALELQGYVKQIDDEDNEKFVTLCTKDLAFEMDVIKKKIKVKTIEQLSLI
ncbi:hypothetical protein UT300009_30320 [Paraclostridium bifermentans]